MCSRRGVPAVFRAHTRPPSPPRPALPSAASASASTGPGGRERRANPELWPSLLRLSAPQIRLKVGERPRTASAPAEDFAIENESSRESFKGREQLGKFPDFIERTRE